MDEHPSNAQLQQVLEVQRKYQDMLLALPHVISVGVGYATVGGVPTEELALVVMVDEKLPAAQLADSELVPPMLDGMRVDVQSAGGMFTAG